MVRAEAWYQGELLLKAYRMLSSTLEARALLIWREKWRCFRESEATVRRCIAKWRLLHLNAAWGRWCELLHLKMEQKRQRFLCQRAIQRIIHGRFAASLQKWRELALWLKERKWKLLIDATDQCLNFHKQSWTEHPYTNHLRALRGPTVEAEQSRVAVMSKVHPARRTRTRDPCRSPRSKSMHTKPAKRVSPEKNVMVAVGVLLV